MKRLVLSRGHLELAELQMNQPVSLIGRSPICDAVLRADGVQSVQFIIEWVGEGEFDPNSGFWAAYSVSPGPTEGPESAVQHEVFGEGFPLSDETQVFSGFEFRLETDGFASSDIEPGALRREVERSVDQPVDLRPLTGARGQLLEVSKLSDDGESVREIEHLTAKSIRHSRFAKAEPGLSIDWNQSTPTLSWADSTTNVVSLRSGRDENGLRQRPLSVQDVLKVSTGESSYYLRMVPAIAVPKVKQGLASDPFFKFAGIAAFVIVSCLYLALQVSPPAEKKPEPPPRVATVQIKEIAKVEPPPPEKPPEPPPEIPKVEPPPPAEEKVSKVPPPVAPKVPQKETGRKSTAAAPSFKSPKAAKPTAGLNSPAPLKNVNSVGLLGSFKKSGAVANTVSADKIMNDGLVSQTVSGEHAKVTVGQPPSGIVDLTKSKISANGGQGGGDVLASAGTTLTGGDEFDVKSNGPIGRKGGLSGYSIGTNAGGEATGKVGPGGVGDSDRSGESVTGGLTREQVRRAIAPHRSEIRACYERGLAANSSLKGRVQYKWYVAPSGPVTSISLEDTSLNNPSVESCVSKILRAIVFPKAPNGQPTTVIYPFVFQNS